MGDCYRIAPEVFSADRYGYPIVTPPNQEDDEVAIRVREAAIQCPEGAIVVWERSN